MKALIFAVTTVLITARPAGTPTGYLGAVDYFVQAYRDTVLNSHTAQLFRDANDAYRAFVLNEDPFAERDRMASREH